MTSTLTKAETSPVFVDRTGRRGRRLRGLGWLLGLVLVGFVLAMISGLVGTQSHAPAFSIPSTADTAEPGQYVNAPLPSAPLGAGPATGAPSAAGGEAATPTGAPASAP
ncbi:hypothetical protein ABZ883_12280 [Streptomyces sp. NPDC046977]|uniref:hypothetical protein n=1 Tax=Streptomyces sp. NPDC046977 TaxID=3154703 RepID=UPI00340E9E86